jgi:uncharacterized membrane protein YdbT with pleckstrin-like domain
MANGTEDTGDDMPIRYFKEQFDDEDVLLVFRKHPVVMRRGLVFACVGLLIPMLVVVGMNFVYANNPERLPTVMTFYIALAIGFLLGLLIMLPWWISWNYSVYIFTDQRMIQIAQKGLFKRSMVAIGVDQIQMVNYEIDGIEQTLLGFGTIVVQTYVGSLTISHVHHPAKIQKKLLHLLRDLGHSMGAGLSPQQEGIQDEE